MKYQCTVCGQFSNRSDVCTCCGVGGDKIITVNDSGESNATLRCVSCGRVFDNKDVCPFCGGEDLYDLTNDRVFNRNKVNKEDKKEISNFDDDFNLLDGFNNSIKNDFKDEETFQDQVINLEHREEKEEDLDAILDEDINENITLNEDESNDDLEEKENESFEEVKEKVEENVLSSEEENLNEENFDLEERLDLNEESPKEEDNSLLDLKIKRIDLTKDLIIKLFMKKENNDDPKYKELLENEISILNKLNKSFENEDISSILEEKDELNKKLFDLEKDDPFNGYILFLESSKKDIK